MCPFKSIYAVQVLRDNLMPKSVLCSSDVEHNSKTHIMSLKETSAACIGTAIAESAVQAQPNRSSSKQTEIASSAHLVH
jgi:hypothetical protein